MAIGRLRVNVYADTVALPIKGAIVHISGNNIETNLITDVSGKTISIELDAPDKKYSLVPQNEVKPFTEYTIRVSKDGFINTIIKNVEIFPDVEAIQDVYLVTPDETEGEEVVITITPPTIWDPPVVRFPTLPAEEKVTFVLPSVLVPDYIIVQDGAPASTGASIYYVPFTDYIKNVTCSEIYSTWPTETLKANVHTIVSFTLNRVFTEWYRSKGMNFTVTSLPAYDQQYTKGRAIYDTIEEVVDAYFDQYIRIGSQTQPLLAHYFAGQDGSSREGWLSQWRSKTLGDQGYTALQIIRYFYGQNASLYNAPVHDNYLISFPGYVLMLGSCGEPVQLIQNRLNRIRGNYPLIPAIPNANGVFDENTVNAVRTFQEVFGLSVTGVVDFATWYRISYYYIAVAGLQKLEFGVG